MMKKLQYYITVLVVLACQSSSFSQVVGTPHIIPHYKNVKIFNYTGAIQTWMVPDGVTEIYVDVMGAQGGNFATINGGAGGRVRCKILVSTGQVLYLTVGGQPNSNIPAYGFGGAGGYSTIYTTKKAMAGGGLSAISTGNPVTQSNALVIAGGGGGANGNSGAAAGGLSGASSPTTYGGFSIGGKGATQLAGGAAGVSYDPNSPVPTAGTGINGGAGGIVGGYSNGWNGGGGGGAGYFGGGGGAGGGNAQAGGGGGSSWIKPAAPVLAVGSINMGNQNANGHGRILIYY